MTQTPPMTNPNPPNGPPNGAQLGWYNVFGFVSTRSLSFAKKATVWCVFIAAAAGAIAAGTTGINYLRDISATAKKNTADAAVVAYKLQEADEAREAHSQAIEATVMDMKPKVDALIPKVESLAATLDSVKKDVAALAVKNGITPHATADPRAIGEALMP